MIRLIASYRADLSPTRLSPLPQVIVHSVDSLTMVEVSKSPSPSTELDQEVYTLATLNNTALTDFTSLQDSEPQDQLHAAVDKLLDDLESKFDKVSNEVLGKSASLNWVTRSAMRTYQTDPPCIVDDMTRRLEELEASLAKTNPPPPDS